jgi:hypothetical protein
MMVGLIVTCLPSLRPYFRKSFKSSTADSTPQYHISNTIGGGNITVNRKVTTTNSSGRWREHGQFEELNEGSAGAIEEEGRIVVIGNEVQVDGGRAGGRDSWQEDKRSNHSDVELIYMKDPASR